MSRRAAHGIRSTGFWLIVAASAGGHLVNSSTAPVVSRAVQEDLGGDPALAGALVALTGVASVASMALAGFLVDRRGVRPVVVGTTLLALAGLAAVLVSFTVGGLAVSRLLFGAGNAGVAVALTTWVVASTPAAERGRALGYFGISVWVGLALGPLLGESVYQAASLEAVWAVALGLQAAALALVLVIRDAPPAMIPTPGSSRTVRSPLRHVMAHVAAPGVVALVAWAAEGLMIAFLIQHLAAHGLPETGLLGAANVFTIFACSVVATRLLIGGLADRWGSAPTARLSLVVLAMGLIVFALADSFALAAVGGVLVGIGYSPLYPALTLLATDRLPHALRASGIGVFSSITSVGYAVGAFGGGVLIGWLGSEPAFLVAAAAQLAVLPLVRKQRTGEPALATSVEDRATWS